jgi:hypothetical protein
MRNIYTIAAMKSTYFTLLLQQTAHFWFTYSKIVLLFALIYNLGVHFMKLKDFAEKAFYLPATAFSGLANLVLGYTEKPKVKGSNEELLDEYQPRPKQKPGLLTLALSGINYVAVGIANFIAAHQKAIAIAFWASLALAGAAALTLLLWPAALTAVAGFTVYGLSIGAIAGGSMVAEIGLAAALTFAATSAATYLAATVVNAFTAARDFFKGRRAPDSTFEERSAENDIDFDEDQHQEHSASKLSGLGHRGPQERSEFVPQHTSSPLPRVSPRRTTQLVEEDSHEDLLGIGNKK